MGWFILGIFIVTIAACVIWGAWEDGITGALLGILLGLLFGLLILFLFYVVCAGISMGAETIVMDEPAEVIELVSFEDKYGIEGYFYRRSGTVDNTMEYVYLYNETGKGVAIGAIPTKNTYLNESDTEVPRIEIYHSRYKNEFLHKMFGSEIAEYIVYIPNNSIIANQYVIDLE